MQDASLQELWRLRLDVGFSDFHYMAIRIKAIFAEEIKTALEKTYNFATNPQVRQLLFRELGASLELGSYHTFSFLGSKMPS